MISYISTRGGGEPQSFEQVLLRGLAPDGGLYVPETWPSLDFEGLKGKSYTEIAEAVMYPFVEGSIPRKIFRNILGEVYSQDIFRHSETVPLHKIADDEYVLELFHGPTIAFKDVALQLLGRLFDYVLTKRDEHVTIVGATSGDTGSAAIEGCYHSRRMNIFILHPKGRVSEVQRRQMTTIDAQNVYNIAVEGSFDDCQAAVKGMFNDHEFREEINLSAVNSINWARIMAQIVYYVTSALTLGAPEKEVAYVVPTGNFGNVFAGYVARKMGLPIRLVIATNQNDILTRFFESGKMLVKDVVPTITPSMDIQVSSNFERFLFDMTERDAQALKSLMASFSSDKPVSIAEFIMSNAQAALSAYRCDEGGTLATIKDVYEQSGYVLDPHTAVGVHAARQLRRERNVKGAIVTLGTAHPAKFPDAVKKATGICPELPEHLSDLFTREEYLSELPNDLETLQNFVREHKIK